MNYQAIGPNPSVVEPGTVLTVVNRCGGGGGGVRAASTIAACASHATGSYSQPYYNSGLGRYADLGGGALWRDGGCAHACQQPVQQRHPAGTGAADSGRRRGSPNRPSLRPAAAPSE